MKLLQALRQQIQAEQTKVANIFAKEVGFKSIHDSHTVIEREDAKHAWKWLVQNKQLLLDSFPKENVKKLMMLDTIDEKTDYGDVLVIFKQILRSQKARLISRKRYDWSTEQRRQSYTLEYRIISATPDPPPTRPVQTISNTQTNKSDKSNTNTSNTNISDTKVSSTDQKIPSTDTTTHKRKPSPTPDPTQQPIPKKIKPDTPQKQQQPISNENVSNTMVSNASPIHTQPPNSPVVQENTLASPIALSPSPEGGLQGEAGTSTSPVNIQ